MTVVPPSDTTLQTPQPPACTRISELIRNATISAHNADYPLANRLLNEASAQIEDDRDLAANEWQKSLFYDEMVNLYTTVMPPEYSDSTCDEVSILIFQDQFNESLDSTDVVVQDSLTLTVLACQRRSLYDIPIVCNTRVLKAMRFLKSRRKGPLDKWLERAHYYLPVMRKVFADSGLPRDLAYLPLIESGFNPKAYSRAKASGIWQFIPSTGDRFGLRRGFWVDERRDPLKATMAAASYLKRLYAQFGHWYLALAAYNCGENGLQRSINSCGTNDFWKLKLPRETVNYVPEFIAAVILAKNPDRFGVVVQPTDTFSFDTVAVSDCIDLSLIEKGVGLEPDILKERNPHLMQWCTPPDVSGVNLYLPLGYKEAFLDLAVQLGGEEKIRWIRHKIARGENLGGIARRYGLTVHALKSTSGLKSNKLRAGAFVLIPVRASVAVNPVENAKGSYAEVSPTAADAQQKTTVQHRPVPLIATPAPLRPTKNAMVYRVAKGDNLSALAALFGVTVESLARANDMEPEGNLRAGQLLKIPVLKKTAIAAPSDQQDKRVIVYEVKPGDTLWDIAQNFGIAMKDLYASNNLDKGKRILPGEKLRIPMERL